MPNNDDQKLIEEYFKGNLKSLDSLIEKYLTPVFRLIFCYVKNESIAEDLTQETFIKVWRHLKKFDKNKNFRNWVLIIAKNTALDFLKKKKDLSLAAFDEKYVDELLDDLVSAEIAPDDLFDFDLRVKSVKDILQNSSKEYWEVFSLYYFGGFNFREIAQKLNKPLNTVKSQYRRALLLVKNKLQ